MELTIKSKTSFIAFVATSMLIFASCSSSTTSNPNLNTKTKIKKIEIFNELNDDFSSFLTGSENRRKIREITSPKSTINDSIATLPSESHWNMNEAYEYADEYGEYKAQMVESTDKSVIACAYVYTKEDNTKIVMMTKDESEDYTIYDEYDTPVMVVHYNSVASTLTVKRIIASKEFYSLVCNGAMATLGVEVGMILAVPTGGTSAVGFAILWSVVSHYACK